MTSKIEKGIEKYIAKIDEMGGALEAIKKGYIQREIRRSSHVDSVEQVVVGVNKFTTEEEPEIQLLEIDESAERKQKAKLNELRRNRDNKQVGVVLDKVRRVAKGDGNIMPALIEAVKAYATVGEITDALRPGTPVPEIINFIKNKVGG